MKAFITILIGATALAACGCGKPAKPARGAMVSSEPGEPVQGKFLKSVDANGVALLGHDPVAFFTDKRPVMGNPNYQTAYRGAIYQFAGGEHKAMFEREPAKFEPQYGGYSAYAVTKKKLSQIKRLEYWEIVDGRLVLLHNRKAWDQWHKDVSGNFRRADANWPKLVERKGL